MKTETAAAPSPETTHRGFPLAEADMVARRLTRALEHVCSKLEVVGSIRRHMPKVGDIVILYVPRFQDRPDPGDLFGNLVPCNLADEKLTHLLEQNVLVRRLSELGRPSWSPHHKEAIHVSSGVPVDFFEATNGNWACQLVARTGSFKTTLAIHKGAKERGLKWQATGTGFEDLHTGDQRRICWTEEDVFAAVGLPYVEPIER